MYSLCFHVSLKLSATCLGYRKHQTAWAIIRPTGFHFEFAIFFFFFKKLILEKERGRREIEKHQFALPHIYVFTSWFLYVPWPGFESATLAYQDDAPTQWATQPVQISCFLASQRNICGFIHISFFLWIKTQIWTQNSF